MKRNERVMKWLNGAKPYLGVLFLQLSNVGSAIISKVALNQGMNPFTFSVYRNVIATAFFIPFAMLFERETRPTMTTSIFFKIMLLALLEPVLTLNLYYLGMRYSTATFTVTMINLVPAVTFLLAWIFRLENVKIKRLHSQAKIIGTTSTIGGAMIMTLVKGPTIVLPWTKHSNGIVSYSTQHVVNQHNDPIKAALLLTASCCCAATFAIIQAITLKSYPAGLSLTAMICMAGALQGTIFTLILERGNASIWSLHWDITLLTYVYHGLVRSGAVYYISGVIMKEKGPVFVTAFNPLCMVIVAIIGSFVLSEKLYLGRVLGAVVIFIGLYLVIWGKSKDQTLPNNDQNDALPIDHKHPQVQGLNKDIIVV
ncbi:WAT1-related protein At2g39510-like isoform X1 [Ipomoea triloba]|uniref:WAT1-related protein At2g39510-like isoform X1 n=1 Tax=Ipomoea triloba TaxID=35885 RepID=UPI00125E678E|nr:WAT1-related protein At2g39510-like isoform X1 [Ipomoea triloba]